MDSKLQDFLEIIWKESGKGKNKLSGSEIYSYYSGGKFGSAIAAGKYGSAYGKDARGISQSRHEHNMKSIGKRLVEDFQVRHPNETDMIDFLKGFYPRKNSGDWYFDSMNAGKSTTHRMYINTISEKVRKLIQCLVLEEKILEIPGVNSLKVARDPEMIDAHFDPVVLYATLAGIKSADPVMRKVYLAHKSYFVNGIPMLAQPVSPLKGVGWAMEPKNSKGNKSFGSCSCKAISDALEKAKPNDWDGFLKNTQTEYEGIGYNVEKCHTTI